METSIRVGFFLLILILMNIYECLSPWRPPVRSQRWLANYGLVILGAILVRLVIPVSSTLFAKWVASQDAGLFNILDLNPIASLIGGLILLDLAIYGQHWFFHQWTWGWNLHRVHHCDLHLDTSSALRFHPLEILLSMAFKFLLIWILGLSPLTILTFEVILNGGALFNHANIQLPQKLERLARLFIVTPDMHRIHHSQFLKETNSNYGFNLSVWDRLFKTYTDPSNQQQIKIGLEEEKSPLNLWKLLRLPFS